jgi:topoisomerase-4 subunit B
LTRCASRKVELNELFIVEGDSAGGSAKQARDRMHQAILPLKGKPLNTEKATLAKVLANKEILAIVQSVGAGIGGEFEIGSINYGRVVILADADDDGAHIRCLLLTFFYRFMRPLVSSGHVYIAQPPLFKLERSGKKKEVRYAWSQGELEAILQKWGRKAVIQCFKGLGEMDPLQLWETTMNPATRTLVRVTIEDAAQAERQVHTLMGNKADLRKKWISENVRFGDMADRDVDDIDEVENDGSSDIFGEEEANEPSPTNEGAAQELDA